MRRVEPSARGSACYAHLMANPADIIESDAIPKTTAATPQLSAV
jgi:hypothetical protein